MMKNKLYEAHSCCRHSSSSARTLLGAERQASDGPAYQLPGSSSVSTCLHLQQELTSIGTQIPVVNAEAANRGATVSHHSFYQFCLREKNLSDVS